MLHSGCSRVATSYDDCAWAAPIDVDQYVAHLQFRHQICSSWEVVGRQESGVVDALDLKARSVFASKFVTQGLADDTALEVA